MYGAVQLSEPGLENNIRYDEEAEGLAIWSIDRSSLEKISRLVAAVKTNKTLLKKCIATAVADHRME